MSKPKRTLEQMFLYLHENPPAPFNPDYDPSADERFSLVTQSMMNDRFYQSHSRKECKAEWHRRYERMKNDTL